MAGNTEWEKTQIDSLVNMAKAKKNEITSFGITFLISPTTNGYIAAVKNSNGKFGRGATKRMAIGDCIVNNQDPID